MKAKKKRERLARKQKIYDNLISKDSRSEKGYTRPGSFKKS